MNALTSSGLLEIHARAHRNLKDCLDFCQTLDVALFDRTMAEFNGTTIRLQLHHVIGAERYWIGVLHGRIDADEDEDDHLYPTMELIEEMRQETSALTEAYLTAATPEELNTARPMKTWHGDEPMLFPGHVVVRTIVHIYHHMGQVSSMIRLLGQEPPRVDYPIK